MTDHDARRTLSSGSAGWHLPERPLGRRGALRAAWAVGLSGVLIPAMSGCAPRRVVDDMTVAGGERGGFYLEFATLLAKSLQRHGVARRATPITTRGSLDNVQRLLKGEVTLAVALADTAAQTLPAGSGRIVALGRVYENYLHCVVRRDSGIGVVGDLAGKTVGTGAVGSGTSLIGHRIIDVAGVGPYRERQLGLNAGLAALRDGSVDALFWSGGVPTAAITEANDEIGLRFIDLAALIPQLRASHGGIYERILIPENSYAGTPATGTVGVANLLLCRSDLAGTTAAETVNLLVGHAQELIPRSSRGAQFLSAETLIGTAGVPLHPAAAAAYRALHG